MKSAKKCLAAACLLGLAGVANAGTVSVTPGTATALQAGGPTSPTPHSIVYQAAASGETTNNFSARLVYDPAVLTATLDAPGGPGNPTGACQLGTPGTVVIVTQNNFATNLASGTVCQVAFASVAGAALGPTNLDLQTSAMLGEGCLPFPGNPDPTCTFEDAVVTVQTAPPDVTLSYAPAAGSTITFPSGTALTTQNASITVTGGGTVGSGTVTNCGITGAGAGAFGPAPADITVAAGATGTLPLTCTLPNSGGAATATLTCTETDSDTPAPGAARTWNLSCPQGTPVPGPGYSSSPAPGSTLNCDGTPGGSTTTSFTVTNNGNPGAGSELTFTCTAAGAGFSIVSGGSTTAPGLAIGASQTVVVGCTPPAEGAPAATGTVSCTTNAGATPSYNLSSTGVVVPPPVARPAIVPATSYWSQALLVLLLAGLGMAFVGFRRS